MPLTDLPQITDPVIIDGTIQRGASCDSWPPILMIKIVVNTSGGIISNSERENVLVFGVEIHNQASSVIYGCMPDHMLRQPAAMRERPAEDARIGAMVTPLPTQAVPAILPDFPATLRLLSKGQFGICSEGWNTIQTITLMV